MYSWSNDLRSKASGDRGAAAGESDDNKTQALQAGGIMSATQDDKPVAVAGASVSIRVDEHFHRHGWFDFLFDHFDDTRFTRADLQDLVNAGADGPALFALDTSISGPVKTIDGTIATSHGVQIDFAASGHRIIGFADTDGDGSRDPGEHVVFRLADQGSRGFDFDLKGEVDHPASNGGSAAEVLKLDLTHAFSATDSDGDPATLAANSIVVEVGANTHEHGPHEHGPEEPGQNEPEHDQCEQDAPGQHEGGPSQDSSHGHTVNDLLANLIGHDSFFFKEAFEAPVFNHLLDKAIDFLDELAANVPPLQSALTDLEGRFEMFANALHEHLPKNESSASLHQDNFVL